MRPVAFPAVLWLLSACLLSAQVTPAPDPPQGTASANVVREPARLLPATGRLTGHVFCEDTRRPARGALVSIVRVSGEGGESGVMDLMTHAGSDGTYTAEHLPPGRYTAFAAFAGYLTDLDGVEGVDPHMGSSPKMQAFLEKRGSVAVRNGATATYDLTLTRGAAISGKVMYDDGAPAANMDLLVENVEEKRASGKEDFDKEMEMAFQSRLIHRENRATDDQGRFRLAGLRPGSFRIAVSLPAQIADAASQDLTQLGISMFQIADPRALRFYAGDTVFRSRAKVFQVQPGDEVVGTDITVPVDGFHSVRGFAVSADGLPVNEGDVQLQSIHADHLTFVTTLSRDGSFDFEQIPLGSYSLVVSHAHRGEPAAGEVDVPGRPVRLVPRSDFADAETPVLVKDGDVEELKVTVKEILRPQSSAGVAGGGRP